MRVFLRYIELFFLILHRLKTNQQMTDNGMLNNNNFCRNPLIYLPQNVQNPQICFMPIVYNPLFLPNQCTTYIIDEGIYASRNSTASSVRLGKNKEEFFPSVTRSPARHDA